MSEEKRKQHFVLVHGTCHGAWCWYKVKPLLEASGHRVTALDLAASGIDNTRSITDVSTCEQYSEPLMKLLRYGDRRSTVIDGRDHKPKIMEIMKIEKDLKDHDIDNILV